MNTLTEAEIEAQNHLSESRIKLFKPLYDWTEFCSSRPEQSLVNLVKWAEQKLGSSLGNDVQSLLHNKIIMDGSFMHFAEENKIKIECLINDAVSSWNTDLGNEEFIGVGAFKISKDKLNFIHCALFHKGNQNEDEVSFFNLVDRKDMQDYISLRNEYDKYLRSRDRQALEVYVVGGESYSYTKDHSWSDLFLPDDLKKDIIDSVEGFLASKKVYEQAKIPWKRGILFFGEPGNGKSSLIKTIMSNYDVKPVTVLSSSNINEEMLAEAFDYAQSQEPGFLYLEDLDTMLQNISLSYFLNLMDGVNSLSGIIVAATANDLSKLNEAILNRPSRFDRKWEIPMPDAAMTKKYLKHWFKGTLKDKDYDTVAQLCVKSKFSYAYLKELYVTATYATLNKGKPTKADIMSSLTRLISDRKILAEALEHGERVSVD